MISRSSLKVKVIGQRSKSPGQEMFQMDISMECLLENRLSDITVQKRGVFSKCMCFLVKFAVMPIACLYLKIT